MSKENTVNWIYKDSYFAAIKSGIHTQFIVPFALMLGATNQYIALITSAPKLMGAIFQLLAADLLVIMKERKRVLIITSAIDAMLWIPILLIPYLWPGNYVLLLNFLVVQAIATALLNPFYNSLLGDVISRKNRAQVIGRINRITSIFSFIATLSAGLLMLLLSKHPVMGFSIIFFAAFLGRAISTYAKFHYNEPALTPSKKTISLLHFGRSMKKTNFGKFVLFAGLFYMGVGIASPFFAVYMIEELHMNFLVYSVVTGATIISSSFILDRWGRSIDRRGSRQLLAASAFLVPLIPLLWIFLKHPVLLFILQMISGAVWSAFTLSISNFIIDATTRNNRLLMTSYYNFFIGVLGFIGAMIGGFIMSHLDSFALVFGVSAIMRGMVSFVFIPQIKDERFVDIEIKGPKAKRILTIAPQQGVMYDYVPRKGKK